MSETLEPTGLDGVPRKAAEAAAALEALREPAARAVLAAVNSASGSQGGGLGAAIAQAVGGLFSGARADGGSVQPGGAYLVGERGPEVFRPSGAGEVGLAAGGGVVVNVQVDGGAPALLRSEAQIAQMLARAVSLGARRL